jgi:hypothetical protein
LVWGTRTPCPHRGPPLPDVCGDPPLGLRRAVACALLRPASAPACPSRGSLRVPPPHPASRDRRRRSSVRRHVDLVSGDRGCHPLQRPVAPGTRARGGGIPGIGWQRHVCLP